MRAVATLAIFAALLSAAAFAGRPAAAGALDGTWNVLVITEKGKCDRGYRYQVNVANGHVTYSGNASIDMAGTVLPSGAVKVRIRFGDKSADGVGHLSGQTGGGTWHGAGGNTTCAGRWEGERR
jgi:hypothetical protein